MKAAAGACLACSLALFGCGGDITNEAYVDQSEEASAQAEQQPDAAPADPEGEAGEETAGGEGAASDPATEAETEAQAADAAAEAESAAAAEAAAAEAADADALRADLGIVEDFRASFEHGPKGPEYQKYIVLHDTESDGDPQSVIDYWDGNGTGVAAHFIVGKDGSIFQCVPLDAIAHHAGYGDTGHNAWYGVEDESRDDKVGTTPIGDWAADYGMNSYSVGIELVHVGGSGDYPAEQLDALDRLIAYIDAYYGFESDIIDHKAWRSGNSDTSPEFASYLQQYQTTRTHAA
ncbi:N-acetylmuramoyl-L-alanine amidase [Eggerthellaceae bacterium zg-886]|uniref:N-acetylmuramoyl-L-alanine amidase n=2 Tax=Xiamenia xianingshaonis TaxID=2682776 RepID=A0A9E6MS11_9ACTN|nr:N-acetylmuramoyl-L-alanine amidase [Xiamenia xianingshaonis]QTU85262.1 N-acetylmuramoyl-L-alanine amidase [Xiamenia xianingshaonis]